MDALTLAIFVAVYVGLALGRVPGLKIDRTGVAILGAVAVLATGRVTLTQAQAAVDGPTLAVLFGMMMLSVQYQFSGLYAAIADRLALTQNPRKLLAGTIAVTAALSAILTNDVVCLALTPLIGAAILRANLPPMPFFLAIAAASNIGSALTPIGNPQNILIAQKLRLEFLPFVMACALPVIASLTALYVLLRAKVPRARSVAESSLPAVPSTIPPIGAVPPGKPALDRWQESKAVLLTAATLGLFLSPIPTALTALGVAGVVLLSRRTTTREQLALVDWPLLALFVSLFVVVHAFEVAGWMRAANDALLATGANLADPLIFVPVVVGLSNTVSNVPAVMLLLPFLDELPATGHFLALVSTFAGNLMLVGSIANLIVAEQAARLGFPMRFREHLALGVPITAISVGCAVLSHGLLAGLFAR